MEKNPHKLHIYLEGRKRRAFVGVLTYQPALDSYDFTYNDTYWHSRYALPFGPELGFEKKSHLSPKGQLFPSFADRIPDRANPAYADYCASQGISVNEKNVIILLGTIGRRGPSNFVFEPVYNDDENIVSQWKNFRKSLDLSFQDVAEAFDLNLLSLKKIENGTSKDRNLLKLISIFLNFKNVALHQLKRTGGRLHQEKVIRLFRYFEGE